MLFRNGLILYLDVSYTFRSWRHCEFESFIGIAVIPTIKCKLNKLIHPFPIWHIAVTSNIVDSCWKLKKDDYTRVNMSFYFGPMLSLVYRFLTYIDAVGSYLLCRCLVDLYIWFFHHKVCTSFRLSQSHQNGHWLPYPLFPMYGLYLFEKFHKESLWGFVNVTLFFTAEQ